MFAPKLQLELFEMMPGLGMDLLGSLWIQLIFVVATRFLKTTPSTAPSLSVSLTAPECL